MPFWVRRAPKVFVRFLARCLHGPSHRESHRESHKVESLWFIKVVSTLTCICGSKNLTLLSSDYFRKNLSPSISFFVIQHLCTNCRNPRLAFEFFQYTRLNLALIHSVSTFDLLLRLFCRMGLLDFVKLVSDYMSTDGFLVNAALLETLATSLVDAGKFSVAADILISQGRLCAEKNEVVGSFVYNKFLSLLVKRNRVSEAVRFFEDHILGLRGFCPDTCTFNIVIQGLCRTGQFDMALDCFNKMESFGCLPDIFSFNALINGLCIHGKVDRARDMLRGIQSQGFVSPNVVTYTSTIYGFCKVGRMEDAGCLFSDMMAYGVRPNLHTFNVLIDGFCKSGDIPSSLKMFDSMNSFSLAPDVVTFTSLISGYCQNGELDTALKLWDEMHAKELLANAYTFSIVVTALCKVNRLNEARDMLKQILLRNDIVPQAFIYNPVIDGFCKSGNLDEAMTIVEEMEAKKCKPDKYTYTILIMGHCMKGRMHDAIDLFNKMSVVGCAPDQITIDSLVSCLLKAGMASEGYRIKKSAVVGVHQARSSSSKTPDSQWENIGVPVAV